MSDTLHYVKLESKALKFDMDWQGWRPDRYQELTPQYPTCQGALSKIIPPPSILGLKGPLSLFKLFNFALSAFQYSHLPAFFGMSKGFNQEQPFYQQEAIL